MLIEVEGKSNGTSSIMDRSIYYIQLEQIGYIENRLPEGFHVLCMKDGSFITRISNEDGQRIIGMNKSLERDKKINEIIA